MLAASADGRYDEGSLGVAVRRGRLGGSRVPSRWLGQRVIAARLSSTATPMVRLLPATVTTLPTRYRLLGRLRRPFTARPTAELEARGQGRCARIGVSFATSSRVPDLWVRSVATTIPRG